MVNGGESGLVFSSAGVTDSQLPVPFVLTLVVNETGAEADRLIVWVSRVVEPMVAVGVQDRGLGVMVGGGAPVAVIAPPLMSNWPGDPLPIA